ncbi:MAG: YcnI family protein, partial [Bacilli bacterium]
KFTVRVPSEKDSATVKVEVKIPDEVTISRVEPKPGWTYEFERDDSDKVTSITWTAEGLGLGATEFGEFNMQGKVGDTIGMIAWKAYQTYEDGSVVEWTGAEGSKHPASVTRILKATAGSDGHGHGETIPTTDKEDASRDGNTALSLYISIAALVLGLLSFIISLMKKPRSK